MTPSAPSTPPSPGKGSAASGWPGPTRRGRRWPHRPTTCRRGRRAVPKWVRHGRYRHRDGAVSTRRRHMVLITSSWASSISRSGAIAVHGPLAGIDHPVPASQLLPMSSRQREWLRIGRVSLLDVVLKAASDYGYGRGQRNQTMITTIGVTRRVGIRRPGTRSYHSRSELCAGAVSLPPIAPLRQWQSSKYPMRGESRPGLLRKASDRQDEGGPLA